MNAAERCPDLLHLAKPYEHLDDGVELLESQRGAVASQLLTPAPTVAALIWKKRERASSSLRYNSFVDVAAVDRSIASDEAWLKANAAVRRKAVQS
jgi:hypothetical protein